MDITKCTSETCIYREKCLRGRTEEHPSDMQSWCDFTLDCDKSNGFAEFLPISKHFNKK